MTWARHKVFVGGKERCIKDFGKETRRKEPLTTPVCREECNIKVDVQETGWGARKKLVCLRIGASYGLL
jgi:hypothetical protein